MRKENISTYEAHNQQLRLEGRDIAEYEPDELLELLFILYVEYGSKFKGQFNEWKDKVLNERADALTDKQDSFVQDLDPNER